jgi:hypothetical protein
MLHDCWPLKVDSQAVPSIANDYSSGCPRIEGAEKSPQQSVFEYRKYELHGLIDPLMQIEQSREPSHDKQEYCQESVFAESEPRRFRSLRVCPLRHPSLLFLANAPFGAAE